MNAPQRFWSNVWINEWEPNACWIWQGQIRDGYGRFGRYNPNKKRVSYKGAHVVMFLEFGGTLTPKKPNVLHKCHEFGYSRDNPACVNPKHLRAGDDTENVNDAVRIKTHASSRKVNCKRGHLLPYKAGVRECRVCKTDLQKQRRKARRDIIS